MKPVVKYAVMGGGSLVLLFGSFVTFAALSGQPLHKIAILKLFVSPPADDGGDSANAHPDANTEHGSGTPADKPGSDEDPKTAEKEGQKAVEKTVGVLGAFSMPSPFSTDELTDLQHAMKSKSRSLDAREIKVAQRERELDDRERVLDERAQELTDLCKKLDARDNELKQQEAEVRRDIQARDARDAASWKELAKFFEEGEPKDMGKKLLSFGPQQAAQILRSLDDERASAIVNALTGDDYHEYLEAYRALSIRDAGKKKP